MPLIDQREASRADFYFSGTYYAKQSSMPQERESEASQLMLDIYVSHGQQKHSLAAKPLWAVAISPVSTAHA